MKAKSTLFDAIVWKEKKNTTHLKELGDDDKDFELIGSSQYARFQFKPKHFILMWSVFQLQKKKRKVETFIILKMDLENVTTRY